MEKCHTFIINTSKLLPILNMKTEYVCAEEEEEVDDLEAKAGNRPNVKDIKNTSRPKWIYSTASTYFTKCIHSTARHSTARTS